MTVAVSDVFTAADGGGRHNGSPPEGPVSAAGAQARGHAHAHASVEVTDGDGKVSRWLGSVGADLRAAWWLPQSIPTLSRAWAERSPDRTRVPGGSDLLYRGWVVYNHTLALAVPALALALVGALTPAVWIARHPARLTLFLLIAIPLILTITYI